MTTKYGGGDGGHRHLSPIKDNYEQHHGGYGEEDEEEIEEGEGLRLEEVLEHHVGGGDSKDGCNESESYEVSFRPVTNFSSFTSSSSSSNDGSSNGGGGGAISRNEEDGRTFVLSTPSLDNRGPSGLVKRRVGDIQRRQQLLNRNKSLLELEPETPANTTVVSHDNNLVAEEREYHAPSLDEEDERELEIKYKSHSHDNTTTGYGHHEEHQKQDYPAFHPALKAAVYAEGQEIVWQEEQYSDVTSVIVNNPTTAPEPKQPTTVNKEDDIVEETDSIMNEISINKTSKRKNKKGKRKSMLRSFRLPKKLLGGKADTEQQQLFSTPQPSSQINNNVDNENHSEMMDNGHEGSDEPSTVKIHVKKMMMKKSILLLPQNPALQGNNEIESEMTSTVESFDVHNNSSFNEQYLIETNELDEAAAHMVKARQLLSAALAIERNESENGHDQDDEHVSYDIIQKQSEEMARLAFAHATAARKITATGNNMFSEGSNSITVMDSDLDKAKISEPDLDEVLSCLAEKGQDAVMQHQRATMSQNGSDTYLDSENRDTSNSDETLKDSTQQSNNRKNGIFSGYAARAVHYLEAILPKRKSNHEQEELHSALSDDFWSDAGISTLGMKNDTFEYGFDTPKSQEIPNVLERNVGSGQINMGLMSITSLNEILDGGATVEDAVDVNGNKISATSPRVVVPVIDVPKRSKPSKSTHQYPAPTRRGLLGLLSPLSTTSSLLGGKHNTKIYTTDIGTIPEEESVSGTSNKSETSADQNNFQQETENVLFVTEEEFVDKSGIYKAIRNLKLSSNVSKDMTSSQTPSKTSGFKLLPVGKDTYKNVFTNKVEEKESTVVKQGDTENGATSNLEKDSKELDWDKKKEVYEKRVENIYSLNEAVNNDWDGDYDPTVGKTSESKADVPTSPTKSNSPPEPVEPVGKTPRFSPIAPTPMPRREVANEDELDPIPEETNENNDSDKRDDVVSTSRASLKPSKIMKENKARRMKSLLSPESSRTHAGEKSVGSKTQIFSRILGGAGQKRDPMIPTGVVEQTYIVQQGEAESKLIEQPQSKTQEKISNYLTAAGTSRQVDENTIVIEQAIAHGLNKANQSNEEGGEAPVNYLEIMLRRKLKEERRKERQQAEAERETDPGSSSSEKRSDADSYVLKITEKIKGGRHQEVPGVYFGEELGQDQEISKSRDPDDNQSELRVMAPTPRSNRVDIVDVDKREDSDNHDPPLDDDRARAEERDRQRMITERLYAIGNSSFDNGNESNQKESDCARNDSTDKPGAGKEEDLALNPTVETVESDQGEDSQVSAETNEGAGMAPTEADRAASNSHRGDANTTATQEEIQMTAMAKKKTKKIGGILGRSRRLSHAIIPGIRKLKA